MIKDVLGKMEPRYMHDCEYWTQLLMVEYKLASEINLSDMYIKNYTERFHNTISYEDSRTDISVKRYKIYNG